MRRLLITLLVFIALGIAGFFVLTDPRVVSPGPEVGTLPAPDIENGKLLFAAGGCASCHATPGQDDKTRLGWQLTRVYMAKNKVKLLLNMLVIAGTIIPRGGQIAVEPIGEGAAGGFVLTVTGTYVRIPQALAALVSGQTAGPIDAHGIQPFYAGLLARTCGLAVSVEQQGERVVINAA